MSDLSFLDSVMLEIAARHPEKLVAVDDSVYIDMLNSDIFDFKGNTIDFKKYKNAMSNNDSIFRSMPRLFSVFIKYIMEKYELYDRNFACVLDIDASIAIFGKLKDIVHIADEVSELPAHIYIIEESANFVFYCSMLGDCMYCER